MCDLNSNYAFMPHKRDANKPTIGTFGGRVLSLPRRELQCFPGRFRLDCKTVSFFLKISKEIGKAWRKNLKRAQRASLTRPPRSVSPQSRSMFSASFDCSRVLEYAKIRTVLQSSSGWHKIILDRGTRQVWINLKVTRNQLNKKIRLIRSAILALLYSNIYNNK